MESVFQISFCPDDNKVRFDVSTFMDSTLTWWNNQVKTLGIISENSLSWEELKMMLKEEYYPRDEIQVMELQLWTLKMKGFDIKAYTSRFHDLALLCTTLVTPEYKKIEHFVWGLVPQIRGIVFGFLVNNL